MILTGLHITVLGIHIVQDVHSMVVDIHKTDIQPIKLAAYAEVGESHLLPGHM